jgi:hypothetical protein
MVGVQAPKPGRDYSWEIPTASPTGSPPAAAVTAPAASIAPTPVPATVGLTPAEVKLVVRTTVEDIIGPLERTVAELQQRVMELQQHLTEQLQRVMELERRPPPAPPTLVLASTPRPSVVASSPYASAIAAPIRTGAPPPRPGVGGGSLPPPAPMAPLLDVHAIEQEVGLGIEAPFDGRRRRRRMATILVIALLAIFGALAYVVASSYAPHS